MRQWAHMPNEKLKQSEAKSHLLGVAFHEKIVAPVVSGALSPLGVECVGDHCLLQNSEVASH
jgi:hypothetical protein